jgi:Ca-activated chloride channel homolog
MRRAFVLATLTVASAIAGSAAQNAPAPQAPVFRAGAETVAIYATVLDRAGQLVRNLPKSDFDVYDDNVRQDLTVFVNGLQPITAALLVDTSASMTLNLQLAQSAAEQFVIRMLPGDKVRVGSFSDRVDVSPDFTGDRDALLTALRDGLHIGNPTKLWDAVGETMTSLAPLGGRRIIVVLTDGMDTASQTTADAILERARTDELMVYVVQFRSSMLANMAEFPLSPSAGELFGGSPSMRNRPPSEVIRRIAGQTGGGHFVLGPTDDVNATFTQVMEELHYQYVLGFTPRHADGRLHDLVVRVHRPGLTIRARRSYLASKPSAGGP